jgi:hypothetical protein
MQTPVGFMHIETAETSQGRLQLFIFPSFTSNVCQSYKACFTVERRYYLVIRLSPECVIAPVATLRRSKLHLHFCSLIDFIQIYGTPTTFDDGIRNLPAIKINYCPVVAEF